MPNLSDRVAILELRGREEVDEALEEIDEHYLAIARAIWPAGAMLRCPRCGRVQTAGPRQIARYSAQGWPHCCGETMHVADGPSN